MLVVLLKMKKKKKKSQEEILHEKLWDIFSQYIRKRDKGTCFTCGVRKWDEELGEFTIKGFQAGHFRHAVLDFDEMNINCQCVRCNHFLSGNGVVYARNLEAKYGHDAVEELHKRADRALKGELYAVEWYLEKIEYYKKQLLTI